MSIHGPKVANGLSCFWVRVYTTIYILLVYLEKMNPRNHKKQRAIIIIIIMTVNNHEIRLTMCGNVFLFNVVF